MRHVTRYLVALLLALSPVWVLPAKAQFWGPGMLPSGVNATSGALAGIASAARSNPVVHSWWSPPTDQFALPGRTFLGAAVADTGDNTFPQADWLSQLLNVSYNGGPGIGGTGLYSQVYILGDINGASGTPPKLATPFSALSVGNATINGISTGPTTYSTTRALEVYGINNTVTAPTGGGPNLPVWAFYDEAHRVGSQAGQTYAAELEPRNSVGLVSGWDPYQTATGYGTIGIEVGCGAGLSATGQFDCTSPLYFAPNPKPFQLGILFFNGSVDSTGVGGSKPAILMPQDYDIQWFGAAGTLAADIKSDVSSDFLLTAVGTAKIVGAAGATASFNPSGRANIGIGMAPVDDGAGFSDMACNGSTGCAYLFYSNAGLNAQIYNTGSSFNVGSVTAIPTLWLYNNTETARVQAGMSIGSTNDPGAGALLVKAKIGIPEVAYASRPVSPATGDFVNMSDSNTATWGATIAGGGTNHVLARYNGTNWTVVGD